MIKYKLNKIGKIEQIIIFVFIGMIFLIGILVLVGFASGVESTSASNVCCEKTLSGLYCQDLPVEQCDNGINAKTGEKYRYVETSCKSVSYCKPGVCYDNEQGTCMDNTPQISCNVEDKGFWAEQTPPQCALGCCVLGDQAAFVSLVRCKWLAGILGISSKYNKEITNEVDCVASVQNQQKGACVYDFEFQRTCRITTRGDCKTISGKNAGEFYLGKLCTAKDLNTICGKGTQKTCVDGKEEVYSLDTCGNPSNIYNPNPPANYWEDILEKDEIGCTFSTTSPSNCGNCVYSEGSICRTSSSGASASCVDINCKSGNLGKLPEKRKFRYHGESWCENSDNSVGSRNYKYICTNGEVVPEDCYDYRNEVCVENNSRGEFSEAQCIVNKWQDCILQTKESDCKDDELRDCKWIGGDGIKCVPLNSPGLKFWETNASENCGLATTTCVGRGTKKIGGNWHYKGTPSECIKNNGDPNENWVNQQIAICRALGDCGNKKNWINVSGKNVGYSVTRA